MTLLGETLRRGAELYVRRWGWVAHPTTNDQNGYPKIPLTKGWPRLTADWNVIKELQWSQARGIALVLGSVSAGLSCIDVDDENLATAAFEVCALKTRCIRTIRRRGHIYLTEENPSGSTAFHVEWHGTTVQIELKAVGSSLAAPPTAGYEHVGDRDQKPMTVPSIRYAWDALATRLGIQQGSAPANAGYPRAWAPQVEAGDRNRALYVEAHRLREAKMPLDQALAILQVRWEQDYAQGGQTWYEVERTIRSAYRRPVWPGLEGGRDELSLLS